MTVQIIVRSRLINSRDRRQAYQIAHNHVFHQAVNELQKIIIYRPEDNFLPRQFKVDYELELTSESDSDTTFQLLTMKMSVHI